MTSNNTIDAARVELLLSELRLPAIKLRQLADLRIIPRSC